MSVILLIDKYKKQIEKDISSIKDSMSQGAMVDIREYAMACGRIQGMNQAIGTLEDVRKKYLTYDDDDE